MEHDSHGTVRGSSFRCPPGFGKPCLGSRRRPLCRGPRACVLRSLGYNHPFMFLGHVGTESRLHARVTCGLAPAHSLGVQCGSPQRWLPGKTQSRYLPGSS